jgi:hypothetical protein
MRDMMFDHSPWCSPSLNNCGNAAFAVVYCVSLMIFTSFLLISLVVAVVLKQFEESNDLISVAGDYTNVMLTMSDLREFAMHWTIFAPSSSMHIRYLASFLSSLPSPSFQRPKHLTMTAFIHRLHIPIDSQNSVLYIDVLYRLAEYSLRAKLHARGDDELSILSALQQIRNIANTEATLVLIKADLRRQIPRLLLQRASQSQSRGKHIFAGHVHSVLLIQAIFRYQRHKKLLKRYEQTKQLKAVSTRQLMLIDNANDADGDAADQHASADNDNSGAAVVRNDSGTQADEVKDFVLNNINVEAFEHQDEKAEQIGIDMKPPLLKPSSMPTMSLLLHTSPNLQRVHSRTVQQQQQAEADAEARNNAPSVPPASSSSSSSWSASAARSNRNDGKSSPPSKP